MNISVSFWLGKVCFASSFIYFSSLFNQISPDEIQSTAVQQRFQKTLEAQLVTLKTYTHAPFLRVSYQKMDSKFYWYLTLREDKQTYFDNWNHCFISIVYR